MTDAHDSKDLTKVRVRFGAEGYAVYWYCLELIAGDLGENQKITFELKHDAEVIAHNLKLDSVRVEEMMRYMVSIGLFEQSGDIITCLKLAKYLDKKSTRNTTIHRIVDKAQQIVADKSGQSRTNTDSPTTVPRLSGLDTDTDTDTKKNIGAKRATQAPNELAITDDLKTWLQTQGIATSIAESEVDRFLDYHRAKGSTFKSWDAAFRTWMRNWQKWSKEKQTDMPQVRGNVI